MGSSSLTLALSIVLVAGLPVAANAAEEAKREFIDATVCRGCHATIYHEWSGSLHSLATKDPIYARAARLFLSEAKRPRDLAEAESCVKCHAPLAVIVGEIAGVSGEVGDLKGVYAQGVTCDLCHWMEKALGVGDARYQLAPPPERGQPGTRFGPYRDAESPFHGASFSPLQRSAESCGTCHDVSHVSNLLPIEQTYSEWVRSPYYTGDPATTVICQDCHMRQQPGRPSTGMTERPLRPGKAAIMGRERAHAPTHFFVGANAAVPAMHGSDVHVKLAAERLEYAARLELAAKRVPGESLARVRVKVWNDGAGHYLPTGITQLREMWLELEVEDASGRQVFASGQPDGSGDLPEGARIFHTILGTPQGRPTLNIALADRVLFDKRIPPKGYVEEEFSFAVPQDAALPLSAKARLRYRSASQKVARLLFEGDAPTFPIVEMAAGKVEVR